MKISNVTRLEKHPQTKREYLMNLVGIYLNDVYKLFYPLTPLRTFALIVYAHPYCARNSCRNAMARHARARALRKKSIHMKGWYPFR